MGTIRTDYELKEYVAVFSEWNGSRVEYLKMGLEYYRQRTFDQKVTNCSLDNNS